MVATRFLIGPSPEGVHPLERDLLPVPMAFGPHVRLLVALAFGGWQLVVDVLDARAVLGHVCTQLADHVHAARRRAWRAELDVGDARAMLVLPARRHLELLDRRVELRLDLLQLPGRRLPQDCAARVQRLAGAKLAMDRVLVGVPRLCVAGPVRGISN